MTENLTLSDEERRAKLQQLADNKIRLIREQEELEQRQMELFGIRLPEDRMRQEIEDASSYWLSPTSIQRIVHLYLQKSCEKDQEFILGEKPLKTLRLSQEARGILLRDYQKLPKQNTITYREWENWLKGGNPQLKITFESNCAAEHPEAAFMMPLHPLVRQAAMAFDIKKRAVAMLKAHSSDVAPGRYEFAIYQWRFHGIKEDLLLRPVASSPTVTSHLARLLEKATDLVIEDAKAIDPNCWDVLDAQHYELWADARAKHRQRTQELAEFRRESLTKSHRARIALIEEQLKQASNEKIKKMRRSQISAAEADYARRIQDLDIATERAEITAEPVAYGVLEIIGDTPNANELR